MKSTSPAARCAITSTAAHNADAGEGDGVSSNHKLTIENSTIGDNGRTGAWGFSETNINGIIISGNGNYSICNNYAGVTID